MNFLNINYLKHGNERQQRAYFVLEEYAVMQKLEEYSPVLVGTIPIGIDIENSDLDIVCCWKNKEDFISAIISNFSLYESFHFWEKTEKDAVVAGFFLNGFEIEIFGQNTPVTQQAGYSHMIIEHRILTERDEAFRRKIIELKKQGLKTEPAFARLLNLEGDPYVELLKYK